MFVLREREKATTASVGIYYSSKRRLTLPCARGGMTSRETCYDPDTPTDEPKSRAPLERRPNQKSQTHVWRIGKPKEKTLLVKQKQREELKTLSQVKCPCRRVSQNVIITVSNTRWRQRVIMYHHRRDTCPRWKKNRGGAKSPRNINNAETPTISRLDGVSHSTGNRNTRLNEKESRLRRCLAIVSLTAGKKKRR